MAILPQLTFPRKLGRAEGGKKNAMLSLETAVHGPALDRVPAKSGTCGSTAGTFHSGRSQMSCCCALLLCTSLHPPISHECYMVRHKANGKGRWRSKWLSLGHGQCGCCATMLPTAISLCSVSPALMAHSHSLGSMLGMYFVWLTRVNCTADNQQLIPGESDLVCIRVRKRRVRSRWGKHWLYQLYKAACKLCITLWGKGILP